jgi:hypothetical protein
MSLEAQRVWVETLFKNQIGAQYPAVPIKFENAHFIQPETPWVALFILDGSAFQTELGVQTVDRHTGLVHVDVLVPQHTGTSRANTIAEFVGNVFRRQTATMSDGAVVRFRVPSMTKLGEQSGFYRLVCRIPYIRDEVRR